MDLELRRSGSILMAKIRGELDLSTSPAFRDQIEAELQQTKDLQHLILDFTETNFIDSSGLGVILGRYKTISQRGGRLSAVNVPLHLQKLFELSGLLKIMTIYPSLREAQNKI